MSSVPTGATVIIDGKEVGVTPVTVLLSRSSEHTVIVKRGTQQRAIVFRPHGPDAEAIGLTVAEALPGTAVSVWLALNPCPGGMFSGLCEGIHGTGLCLAATSAVVPVLIDLAFNSYDHLEPSVVTVEF